MCKRLRISEEDFANIYKKWYDVTVTTLADEYEWYCDGEEDERMKNPINKLSVWPDYKLIGYLGDLRDAEDYLNKVTLLQEALDI